MTDKLFPKAPIVIAGCQRSGTTLLRTMLGNHPGILAHPDEPQFILGLFQRFGYSIKNLPAALDFVTKHPYFPLSISPIEFAASFDSDNSIPLKSFILRYLTFWGAEDLQMKHPVLKHPQLILHLDLISELIPNAIIIHIVRDPRANVQSQRNRWPQFTIWDCAMLWKKAVRSARKWSLRNPQNYHEVNYEELVLNPKGVLENLLTRLGLPYTDEVLSFDYQGPIYADGKHTGSVHYQSADPSRINRWKDTLSSLEIRRIEYACRKEMLWFDYNPTHPTTPAIPHLIALWVESVRHVFATIGRKFKSTIRQAGWRLGFY